MKNKNKHVSHTSLYYNILEAQANRNNISCCSKKSTTRVVNYFIPI